MHILDQPERRLLSFCQHALSIPRAAEVVVAVGTVQIRRLRMPKAKCALSSARAARVAVAVRIY